MRQLFIALAMLVVVPRVAPAQTRPFYMQLYDESTKLRLAPLGFEGAGVSCAYDASKKRDVCTIAGANLGNWTFTANEALTSGAMILDSGVAPLTVELANTNTLNVDWYAAGGMSSIKGRSTSGYAIALCGSDCGADRISLTNAVVIKSGGSETQYNVGGSAAWSFPGQLTWSGDVGLRRTGGGALEVSDASTGRGNLTAGTLVTRRGGGNDGALSVYGNDDATLSVDIRGNAPGMGAIRFFDSGGGSSTALSIQTTTLTNAQVLALRATPITVVPAPGAGKFNELVSAVLIFNRTAAYTESADNLAIKYVNGSGTAASASIETTGFVDAAGDAVTLVGPVATPPIITAAGELSNAVLVIHNTGDGEFGGGDAANTIKVVVTYRTHTTGL